MCKGSKINPLLTLDYIQNESENKYFDRKSARVSPVDLAQHVSAFANADGGTLVIGINDRERTLEGINSCGDEKINDFINAPKDFCRPMPEYKEEFIDITNEKGELDRLLLLHIESSAKHIIRTMNDRTYLRIGDKTKEMLGDNIRSLDYMKGFRSFEDEINPLASVDDLDDELLEEYKRRIGAEGMDSLQVLRARNLTERWNGKDYLTNAAVLLFVKNAMQFTPFCRVRFIRVEGREMHVGDKFNVVKDQNFDMPILKIIGAAKAYILTQLRTFMPQDRETCQFIATPEYPEFPWCEGMINAVAHCDYSLYGMYIKIAMFDDRLEIESPGRFPGIVTLNNITSTRFSRNIKISRVMTEFELVRELNEGVKKIYSDMAKANLPPPEYKETDGTVRLILRNDIDRRIPQTKEIFDGTSTVEINKPDDILNQLDETERLILEEIKKKGSISKRELIHILNKSDSTLARRLNHLIKLSLIKVRGTKGRNKNIYFLNDLVP